MSARDEERLSLSLADGGVLQGELSHGPAIGPAAVVFVHGFGSARKGEKASALEAACALRDWTFATFDLRGHGDSTGTLLDLRGTTMLEDLARIDAALAIRGVDRLFLVGSSIPRPGRTTSNSAARVRSAVYGPRWKASPGDLRLLADRKSWRSLTRFRPLWSYPVAGQAKPRPGRQREPSPTTKPERSATMKPASGKIAGARLFAESDVVVARLPEVEYGSLDDEKLDRVRRLLLGVAN
jgi:pimeloyl-ACP methyl ester carboxylesterase